jgi:hypothetical protein
MWVVEVAPSAVRAAERAPDADRRRLETALAGMYVNPLAGDIRRLVGYSSGRTWLAALRSARASAATAARPVLSGQLATLSPLGVSTSAFMVSGCLVGPAASA